MRLAVLSDIHANLPALEAVIADMAAFAPDHVVVAGDSINWGPFSAQVIERIMCDHWAVIRGNHETYLLELNRETAPPYRQAWTLPRYHRQHIPAKWQYVIGSLPDTLVLYYPDLPPIRVVHASLGDHFAGVYPTISTDELATSLADAGISEQTVIAGHVHLQFERHAEPYHFINPGSVGLPLNGVQGADYAILDGNKDGWQVTFRHIEYDKTSLFDEFERIEYIQHHGATGYLAMEEFRASRPFIYGYHQWRAQMDVPDSLESARQFANSDLHWQYLHREYRLNLPFNTIDWKI